MHDFTKLIVAAGHYGLLAETFEIARVLQPAPVVLEDVDLVGGHALEPRDLERAIADMPGAGGRMGARMLGAEPLIGFADTP